jgi:hypothetical protein
MEKVVATLKNRKSQFRENPANDRWTFLSLTRKERPLFSSVLYQLSSLFLLCNNIYLKHWPISGRKKSEQPILVARPECITKTPIPLAPFSLSHSKKRSLICMSAFTFSFDWETVPPLKNNKKSTVSM